MTLDWTIAAAAGSVARDRKAEIFAVLLLAIIRQSSALRGPKRFR